MILFETPRIRVRSLRDTDLADFYQLLSDPEIMRYIRAPFTEIAQAEERMEVWTQYGQIRPGLGTFVMENKESGAFSGTCVARQVGYNPEHEDYEIGYIFTPECWGKGLASELVPPLSQYCFSLCTANHLVAFTHPDNKPSQRALTKGGFRYIETKQTADGTSAVFWLERNAV